MKYIICDDYKLSKYIPFIVFLFFYESLILYALLNWNILTSPLNYIVIIAIVILPILIYIRIIKKTCKIEIDLSSMIIQIKQNSKYFELQINEIKTVILKHGEEFIGDSGPIQYEIIIFHDKNDNVLFSYKTKEINLPYELLDDNKINIIHIEEE